MIYLDEAATAPLKRDVLAAMGPYLGPEFGNPSSHHQIGDSARRAIERARADVAAVLGAKPQEITFTSGGTESDNAALKGLALGQPRGRHIVVSAVEHPAILESAEFLSRFGYEITVLGVDQHGSASPEDLAAALRPDTTLVSIQYANNEVGTIQPIVELAAVAKQHGVPFHTDAVQAAGWLDLDVNRLGVQSVSLSGHKLGAPKGIGVLYTRRGLRLEPLIHGGGQESGRRSGTENVAGSVGFAAALKLARASSEEVIERRDNFIAKVLEQSPWAALTGHRTRRLPGHASFVFPGRSGESILVELESQGIMCSSGSACAAGSDEPSHVLTAMGYDRETAQSAVRFTFGNSTGMGQLDTAAHALGALFS